MEIPINFYSYFKDLVGCERTSEHLPEGATIEELMSQLQTRFPRLAAVQKSTLIAVGVEYQNRSYRLRRGDEVSLFPPVQGG